jgi:hypothetical protein
MGLYKTKKLLHSKRSNKWGLGCGSVADSLPGTHRSCVQFPALEGKNEERTYKEVRKRFANYVSIREIIPKIYKEPQTT